MQDEERYDMTMKMLTQCFIENTGQLKSKAHVETLSYEEIEEILDLKLESFTNGLMDEIAYHIHCIAGYEA